ncbi:MAG: hypothetical protein ACKPH7_23980 [Planktothrix sp.]|uniref:hypothetical protein n=1 Tax=Planktothrix sp. TaxID=3088171 RepID=UPI0038D3CDBE
MINVPTRIDEVGNKFIGVVYPDTPKEMIVASELTYERCERALQTRVKVLVINEEEE